MRKCDVCVLSECGVSRPDISVKLGTTVCTCSYSDAKASEHEIQMEMLGDIMNLTASLVVVYGVGLVGLLSYLVWG